MKKIAFNVMLAASLFTTVACNETKKDDSTEMADEQNEAKFDKNMETTRNLPWMQPMLA